MKKPLLILLFIFITNFGLKAQVKIKYPVVEKQTVLDIQVKSITQLENSTKIDFIYHNSKETAHYIFLHSPGSPNAMYLKANGKVYKLLATSGIGNKNGVTAAYPRVDVEFSTLFEKIPNTTTTFDIIEGTEGDWNFLAVNLQEVEQEEIKPWRKDYSHVAFFESEKKEWGEWTQGMTTFVFNTNDNNDITIYLANGKKETLRRVSDKFEGKSDDGINYQGFTYLDEKGLELGIFLYDSGDLLIGYNNGYKIQFTNLDNSN